MNALGMGQEVLRTVVSRPGVTFRDKTVRILINDAPTMNWRDGYAGNGKAKVELLPKGQVVITMFKNELDSDPRVGEYVQRGGAIRYRIQELESFDELHWLCLCVSSPITT